MPCASQVSSNISGPCGEKTDECSTPLLQDFLGDDVAKRQRREIHFPTGRFGEAIEQAQAVLFLASDESSFVNGTDFVVDGGMTKVRGPRTPDSMSIILITLLGLCYGRRTGDTATSKFCSMNIWI